MRELRDLTFLGVLVALIVYLVRKSAQDQARAVDQNTEKLSDLVLKLMRPEIPEYPVQEEDFTPPETGIGEVPDYTDASIPDAPDDRVAWGMPPSLIDELTLGKDVPWAN